ncbi:WD domain, G-beta repeat [Carpediemonas membranifera]|uniref:Intraflagellar transport protein 122 homolog n=1 Tax=Carpediemonas membranifera TaxID=201153 RepID=A0A8J6B3F0_9EUKA|nr:WD domain, G-beta repeat [Carpediemonas membranifera]|eukprot:KAG9397500.1 WD domain, G-beta repeat [Carpediemonas membranifera]
MRHTTSWAERILTRKGGSAIGPVYSTAWSPDGSKLLVAVDNRILQYTSKGELQKQIERQNHVYCVSYSPDGKQFAVGGGVGDPKDKSTTGEVVIFQSNGSALYRYQHKGMVQCLAYSNSENPVLISCSSEEIIVCAGMESRLKQKKITSRVLSVAWSPDARYFATGDEKGNVVIRDSTGESIHHETIFADGPVWALSFSPNITAGDEHLLYVSSWAGTLSAYQLSGRRVKHTSLEFLPLCMAWRESNLLIGGTDGQVHFFKDGTYLNAPATLGDTWLWSVSPRPGSSTVVLGSGDGQVAALNITNLMVHALYKDTYAFRDGLTDVVVQDLLKGTRVKLAVRKYVRKLALYDDHLAIQTPSSIVIYHTADQLDYRVKHTVNKSPQCSLLVVAKKHIFLCNGRTIDLLDFNGDISQSWAFDADIGYMKIIGGPPGGECVYLGLSDGSVHCVFANQTESVNILRHTGFVRCLDVQTTKEHIIVADQTGKYRVYNLVTREAVISDNGASALAWNSVLADLYVVSSNRILSVKIGKEVIYQQPVQGPVIGFSGTKIFYFKKNSVRVVDIPLANALVYFTRRKDFAKAYSIACVGVPDKDWYYLGTQALRATDWDVARKCFIRLRDMPAVDLISRVVDRQPEEVVELINAELAIRKGQFGLAAEAFLKAGDLTRAQDSLLFCSSEDIARLHETADISQLSGLMSHQADFLESIGDAEAASQILHSLGQWARLVNLLARHGKNAELEAICKEIPASEKDALTRVAGLLEDMGSIDLAKSALTRLGDVRTSVGFLTRHSQYEEALELVNKAPDLAQTVKSAYGDYLAVHGDYERARRLFVECGMVDKATGILRSLISSAVRTNRFTLAGTMLQALFKEELNSVRGLEHTIEEDAAHVAEAQDHAAVADVYASYAVVHEAVTQPVTDIRPEDAMHHALYVLNRSGTLPEGVSVAITTLGLASSAAKVGSHAIAMDALTRLRMLRLPRQYSCQAEAIYQQVVGRPDSNEVTGHCPRCAAVQPLFAPVPETCPACSHETVRSSLTRRVLPVVRVVVDDATREEVEDIAYSIGLNAAGQDSLMIGDGVMGLIANSDAEIILSKSDLQSVDPAQIYVYSPWAEPSQIKDALIPPQVFIQTEPDADLVHCPGCCAFMEEDALERMGGQSCPVCGGEL